MSGLLCTDRALLNDWHVVTDRPTLSRSLVVKTLLLGVPVMISAEGRYNNLAVRADTGERVCSAERYGFIWACLGKPERDILYVPEFDEPDRHLVSGGSIAVRTSGLRAVENFLDMGHFPFVHTGWLGEEPHTEVGPYKVEITERDELIATECSFYQPVASPTATGGLVVDYIFKVMRPYTVALFKSNPVRPARKDVIVLFIQPVDEENCVVHSISPISRKGSRRRRSAASCN